MNTGKAASVPPEEWQGQLKLGLSDSLLCCVNTQYIVSESWLNAPCCWVFWYYEYGGLVQVLLDTGAVYYIRGGGFICCI